MWNKKIRLLLKPLELIKCQKTYFVYIIMCRKWILRVLFNSHFSFWSFGWTMNILYFSCIWKLFAKFKRVKSFNWFLPEYGIDNSGEIKIKQRNSSLSTDSCQKFQIPLHEHNIYCPHSSLWYIPINNEKNWMQANKILQTREEEKKKIKQPTPNFIKHPQNWRLYRITGIRLQ